MINLIAPTMNDTYTDTAGTTALIVQLIGTPDQAQALGRLVIAAVPTLSVNTRVTGVKYGTALMNHITFFGRYDDVKRVVDLLAPFAGA